MKHFYSETLKGKFEEFIGQNIYLFKSYFLLSSIMKFILPFVLAYIIAIQFTTPLYIIALIKHYWLCCVELFISFVVYITTKGKIYSLKYRYQDYEDDIQAKAFYLITESKLTATIKSLKHHISFLKKASPFSIIGSIITLISSIISYRTYIIYVVSTILCLLYCYTITYQELLFELAEYESLLNKFYSAQYNNQCSKESA